MQNNPAAPERNLHHTQSHVYRSQQDFYDDEFSRGAGDPDFNIDPNRPFEPKLVINKELDHATIDLTICPF